MAPIVSSQENKSTFDREDDIESNGYYKKRDTDGSNINESGLLISADTPFFHADLQSAVSAAEATTQRNFRSDGEGGPSPQLKT